MALKKIKSNLETTAGTSSNLSSSNDNSTASIESYAMPLWGGHFGRGINIIVDQVTSSINFERKYAALTIESLQSEIRMKRKRKIISEESATRTISSLDQVLKEITEGRISLDRSTSLYELIFDRVNEISPTDFDSLRTGHSHASQVAGDLRCYVRESYDSIDTSIQTLQASLVDKAEENVKSIFPGVFNNQLSQPTSFGHHLMAYVEMFSRDRSRVRDARRRMNESPYCSGDISGNLFNLNREMVARGLNFERAISNSVDANNSRDFAIEFLSVLSITANNISRFASDIISWHSTEHGFISFSNDFIEQSQITPYSRAPKALESVRSRCAKIYGDLQSSLSILNGLPMSFSNDLLLLGDMVNDAFEQINISLKTIAIAVADMKINRKRMKEAASHSYSTAKDLVDWLVINCGMTVSESECKSRDIIEYAINKGKKLSLLELSEIKQIVPQANDEIYSVLIPSRSLIARRSGGGSNPVQLRKSIRAAKRRI